MTDTSKLTVYYGVKFISPNGGPATLVYTPPTFWQRHWPRIQFWGIILLGATLGAAINVHYRILP